jgi:uncharacterized alkaline shock family protein YloU
MTEYLIATSVLEAIVRGSLAADERVRVHASLPFTRSHTIDVQVEGPDCRATVQLDALLGESMPDVAQEARQKVGEALARMTGLNVTGVDVVFAGVFPPGT